MTENTTLLSLNVWHGKCFPDLMDYIEDCAANTDIFCFQEMLSTISGQHRLDNIWRLNLFSELSEVLPNFIGLFAPARDWYGITSYGEEYHFSVGLATFIRASMRVTHSGDIFVFRNRIHYDTGYDGSKNKSAPRNLQYVITRDHEGTQTLIANFHGIWNGKGKTDTPERIAQSRAIVRFLNQARTNSDGIMTRKILCGDFNLMPKTRSIQMIEETGLTNLITSFNIQETRGRLSPFYGKPDYQKFADYAFVSKDVRVRSFVVPDSGISDHLPMIFEFS